MNVVRSGFTGFHRHRPHDHRRAVLVARNHVAQLRLGVGQGRGDSASMSNTREFPTTPSAPMRSAAGLHFRCADSALPDEVAAELLGPARSVCASSPLNGAPREERRSLVIRKFRAEKTGLPFIRSCCPRPPHCRKPDLVADGVGAAAHRHVIHFGCPRLP